MNTIPIRVSGTSDSPSIVWKLAATIAISATWLSSAPQPVAHGVSVVLAAVLLAIMLVVWRAKMIQFLVRESTFWFGLLFLSYLTLQSANSGRELYFDIGLRQWTYSPVRWPALPFSFDIGESLSMLTLFLPAWVMGLAIRSPLFGTLAVSRLLQTISFSSGILATGGIVNHLLDNSITRWILHTSDGAFATIGYSNHASAFFLLAATLSSGLLFREVFQTRRPPSKLRLAAHSVSLISNLIAVNLSMSRAGILLSWMLVIVMTIFALMHKWRTISPARRLEVLALNVGMACLLFFSVNSWAGESIAKEFSMRPTASGVAPMAHFGINLSTGDRGMLSKAAIGIVRDYAWFGTGGWGFRYLAFSYTPENSRAQLQRAGKANVHCDALQFLSEFGLAGSAILLGILACPLGGAFDALSRRNPIGIMSICGLVMIVVWSVIDLPFRCPAIVYTWTAMFASLPRLRA